MRLNSLSLPKKFSMRCRHLYISSSMARGFARMLGDDDLGAARVEFCDNGVAVERFVGDQGVEGQSLDERRHAHGVEALSQQKYEAHDPGAKYLLMAQA
jgi:hypothetical protein